MSRNSLWLAIVLGTTASAQSTVRVNLGPGGVQANERAFEAATADNGAMVYSSDATNLVPGDTNAKRDVFVSFAHGSTTRVSVSSAGVQGNDHSGPMTFGTWPAISANGVYVAFDSSATNLVTGDTNAVADVFLHNTAAHTTVRVSTQSGIQANDACFTARNSISSDGLYVVYTSQASNLVAGDTNGVKDVYLKYLGTPQTTTRISVGIGSAQANGQSYGASISPDGRYIAFDSAASNLVANDTNQVADCFVHDRQTGTTELVSLPTSGVQVFGLGGGGASISADGRFVAFACGAAFVADDTNSKGDIYLRDRALGTTVRVSLGATGGQGTGGLFGCGSPFLSADGRRVQFVSDMADLVIPDTNDSYDMFVRDLVTGTTHRATCNTAGVQGNDYNSSGSLSPNGLYVGFIGRATNLVSGDTNGWQDVFLRTLDLPSLGDVCANPIPIAGSGLFAFDTVLATTGTEGQGGSSCSAGIDHDVWFVWTADFGGWAEVSLCGQAAFDSKVAIYAGSACPSATAIACNDNACGQQSRVCLPVVAGSVYRVQVGSAPGTAGGSGTFAIFPLSGACGSSLTASDGRTERAHVDSNEAQADASSQDSFPSVPILSSDGRFAVFQSQATNLVAGDTNQRVDVFLRDRWAGTTERISVSSSGLQGDEDSGGNNSSAPSGVAVSADGRHVAFYSDATNLVPGDTNGDVDVFVRDRQLGTTTRVSVATNGAQGSSTTTSQADFGLSMTPDGRYVAFASGLAGLFTFDTSPTGRVNAFVRDRQSGTTEVVSVATQPQGIFAWEGFWPSISADGRYVTFSIDDAMRPDDTNGEFDAYIHDRLDGSTERATLGTGGTQGNSDSAPGGGWLSGNGRFFAFDSQATNLVPDDTNGTWDVFVRDLHSGTTRRVSVNSNGAQVSGGGASPSISADGRYVSFVSIAVDLVPGDTNAAPDVFVHDLLEGTTERVSVGSIGVQGNDSSRYGAFSTDGRFAAFQSSATNLVTGDTNGVTDVFVRDRNPTGATSVCEPGTNGVVACPCANPPSGPGRGCDNSSATGGAALVATGASYATDDSLVFTTSGEKPTVASILIQGTASSPTGSVFGQGVRCAGGSQKRMYTRNAVGGSVTLPGPGDPSISARSAVLGDVLQAGVTRWYFVYYRDPIVLGGCNTSSTFNLTQTIRIDWSF